MSDHPTFEDTYPRYEFSELVRLGIMAGNSILRMLRRARTPAPDGGPAAAPGKGVPAD
jgi:hypothetical protein